MLIFSRDRKKMIDCVSVHITRNYGGGKDGKFCLVGSGGLGTPCDSMLATYPDEKTAMDELEKMFTAFESGAQAYRL